jgi:putative membrane protein
MRVLLHILLSGVAVFVSAYILPGVHVASFWVALIVAIVLAVVNVLVKPLIVLFTLPVTVITLGLFLLVINAAMILLVDWLVPGFKIESFWWAVLYGVVLSFIGGFLHSFEK